MLTHLIASFIPVGLCGSLMVVGGGLSLLFPSCWRRPLPNTLEEAENKVMIPSKLSHSSFSLLPEGKQFESLNRRTLNSVANVYTVPTTQPKFGQERNRGSEDVYYPPSVGGVDFYPLESDSEGSESAMEANGGGLMVDVGGSNWKLLSQFNHDGHGKVYDLKKEGDIRDMKVFSSPSAHSSDLIGSRMPTAAHYPLVHIVAETNL